MPNFTQQVNIATDDAFIHRTQQAAVKTALSVCAEAASVPGHEARRSFAHQVLHNPQRYARLLAFGAVTQASAALELADPGLENIVSTIWNAYAGA